MGLLIFGEHDVRTGAVAVANLGSVCIGDVIFYKAAPIRSAHPALIIHNPTSRYTPPIPLRSTLPTPLRSRPTLTITHCS